MQTETWRRARLLHTWCGVLAAWVLFIVFFAGALTNFSAEIQNWTQPAHRRAPAWVAADVDRALDSIVAAHPEAHSELFIDVEAPQAHISWRAASGDFVEHTLRGDTHAARDARQSTAADLIYRLHYTLGLPETVGMYLVGLICIAYGVSLVSGTVLYARNILPNLFAWRLGQNLRQFWQDAHTAIGVLSLPFHIVFAYTGALFTILILLVAGMDLTLGGRVMPAYEASFETYRPVASSGTRAAPRPLAELLAVARREETTLVPTLIIYRNYGDADATAEVYGSISGHLIRRGSVQVNGHTGAVLGVDLPGQTTLGHAVTATLLALHYGRYGETLTRWLHFALGLAGAALFYTGIMLWLESRRRRTAVPPAAHRILAQLTTGICFGCMLGIAAMLALSLLPMPASRTPDAWLLGAYYVVFFAAIVYALLREPICATRELALCLAVACAALPVINAVATGDHLFATARDRLWEVWWFDATASMFAAGFAFLARSVGHRMRVTTDGSLWNLRGADAGGIRPP